MCWSSAVYCKQLPEQRLLPLRHFFRPQSHQIIHRSCIVMRPSSIRRVVRCFTDPLAGWRCYLTPQFSSLTIAWAWPRCPRQYRPRQSERVAGLPTGQAFAETTVLALTLVSTCQNKKQCFVRAFVIVWDAFVTGYTIFIPHQLLNFLLLV